MKKSLVASGSRPTSSSSSVAATNLANTNKFDEETKAELDVLIQLYLNEDPKYKEVASKLQEVIEKHTVLPPRYDIEGNSHPQSLSTFLEQARPFASSLPGMFTRLCQLQSKVSVPPVRGLPIRFFASRRTALDRKSNEMFVSPPKVQSVICSRPSPDAMQSLHPIKFLQSRELGRNMPLTPKYLFRKEYMYGLNRHSRVLGHLSSIFCVAFDRSGRYIFTGADDNLIKIWDAQRCVLRFTFRGHNGEISDLSISHENSLLASGSVDKTVRIWCLRKGTNLRVFKGHSATVNSIAFLPLLPADSYWRWLVSAGNDCSVVFHRYNEQTKEFIDPPTKFNERATGGARIISASHSPGGNLVIMGDTHQAIIMYKLNPTTVERLYEFTAHSDRVDTLVWAHRALRFVSGSKDGTAKAWSLNGGLWNAVELTVPPAELAAMGTLAAERNIQVATTSQQKKNNNPYKVTMINWSLEDDLVVSIGSDYLLRTWDWRTGQMLAKYTGHQNETFVLLAHPLHKELLISAGHDGFIIVWDIYTGRQLRRHRNENTNREAVAIFDMAISPDGTTLGCVDSIGNLSIYGIGNNQEAMMRPHEQFFSTDYRLLQMDPDGRVTDEDTGMLPELLPPPFFVTSEGNVHPEQEQRLIPGNDIKSNDIIKPCAWLKRDIVPPTNHAILAKYREEQGEHFRLEELEYQQQLAANRHNGMVAIYGPKDQMDKKMAPKKKPQTTRRTAGTTRRSEGVTVRGGGGMIFNLDPYLNGTQPRYILDEEWTDDENDRSFSLGTDEEEEEGDHVLNGQPLIGAQSDAESGSSGNGGEEVDEFEDENDSDYELGRRERETVFREHSTWTVTGKRKRRPPTATGGNEQEQQSSSSQDRANEESRFRSERLRNRALARSLDRSAADPNQPCSSSSLATAGRRIKTRAFIASSSSSDEAEADVADGSQMPLGVKVKKEPREEKEDQKQPRSKSAPGRKRKLMKKGKKKRAIKIEPEDEEEQEIGLPGTSKSSPKKTSTAIGRKKKVAIGPRRVIGRTISQDREFTPQPAAADSKIRKKSAVDYPSWMRQTSRRRFPFIPQLGDLVVYFQQGHRAYLEEMRKNGIQVPSKLNIQSFLDALEVCYIDEIVYKPIGKPVQVNVAQLRLARTKNGRRIGTSFHICYHDLADVIDFLVLKQHYDSSIAMNLEQGVRIESIIDEKFYTGIVTNRDAYEKEYPHSEWSSVSVQWDNGEDDRFSPWDLQRWTRGRKSETPATPQDMAKLGDYQPAPGEWLVPATVLDERTATIAEQLYLDRVLTAIRQLSQLPSVEPFREPVDLRKYRNYIGYVHYPIDLRTIEERIHNHFYRRSLSLLHDVQYLAKNAVAFNDPEAGIGQNGCALVETIFHYMENWQEQDAVELHLRLERNDEKKLTCWSRKLRPAESESARQAETAANSSLQHQQLEQQLISPRRISTTTGGGESTSSGAGVGATAATAQHPMSPKEAKMVMPLWVLECRELVENLTHTFLEQANNSRGMNNLAYEFLENLRRISESVGQHRSPEAFFKKLSSFLSEQKNAVVDAESRRSKTCLAILSMELHLTSKQQPILAKYKRMTDEAEAAKGTASSVHVRQKRAAALSARTLWRNTDEDNQLDDQLMGIERRTSRRITGMRQQHRQESPVAGPSTSASALAMNYSEPSTSQALGRKRRQPVSREQSFTEMPDDSNGQQQRRRIPPRKMQKMATSSRVSYFEEEQDEDEDEEEEEDKSRSSDSDYMDDNAGGGRTSRPKQQQNFYVKQEEEEEDDSSEQERLRLPAKTMSGRIVRPSVRYN